MRLCHSNGLGVPVIAGLQTVVTILASRQPPAAFPLRVKPYPYAVSLRLKDAVMLIRRQRE
ncbi:hypothetical protein ESCAB7627_3867 [Escherichia albertii TW07627]|uniref:Uncharacterized protein n=1 Tax=Escherichia albertii (strain TW07627) TaxID=502347 RepID=A0ABC9NJQ6_ESCAT|nr:hypothetical protein ESCAB7627_3867 [Escherichia albertii TW07627]